jgi:hypothetical protein
LSATETEERTEEESAEDKAAIAAFNALPEEKQKDLTARAEEEGVTIEEMIERGEHEAPTPPMQIPLPGTLDHLSSAVGGPKPTSSEARLLGGSLPIEGQFPLDDTVTLIVEAKVGGVEIVSTTDDWGNVKSVKRRHKMRMVSVRRFGE